MFKTVKNESAKRTIRTCKHHVGFIKSQFQLFHRTIFLLFECYICTPTVFHLLRLSVLCGKEIACVLYGSNCTSGSPQRLQLSVLLQVLNYTAV